MSSAAPPPPGGADDPEGYAVRVVEHAFDHGGDASALAREAADDDECLATIVELIEDVTYLRAIGRRLGVDAPDESRAVASLEALLDEVVRSRATTGEPTETRSK